MRRKNESDSRGLTIGYLAVAIFVGVLLQVNISVQNPVPDYDEAVYLDLIRSVSARGIPIRTSSESLYTVHPPGYFYPAGVLYRFGLQGVMGQRLLQTALSIALLIVLYATTRRVWTEGAARWSVLLLAINPFFLHYAHSVYLELPETLWIYVSLALWLWAEGGKSARWERYVLAGVALGLGALTKYFAVSLGIAYFVYYLIRHRGRFWRSRPLGLIFGASFLLFLMWPVYAWALLGVEGLRASLGARFSGFSTASASDPRTLMGFGDLLARLVAAPGPLVVLAIAVAWMTELRWAVRSRAWHAPEPALRFRLLILIWMVLLLVILFSLPTRDYKYFYPLLPAGFMILAGRGARLFSSLRDHRDPRRLPVAVAALVAGLVLTFPVDLMGIDRVPLLRKLYFTEQDYTWRASPHRTALPGMSKKIAQLARPGETVLVGKAGPIVCYYTGLPYRMTYLCPSAAASERLLDECRIFLVDGSPEKIFPHLNADERARLRRRLQWEWVVVAQAEDVRLLVKAD